MLDENQIFVLKRDVERRVVGEIKKMLKGTDISTDAYDFLVSLGQSLMHKIKEFHI